MFNSIAWCWSLKPDGVAWLQDHQCSYAHSREEQLGEHNLNSPPHHKHKNQQLVREQKSAQEQFQYMPPGFLGVSAEVLRDLHSGFVSKWQLPTNPTIVPQTHQTHPKSSDEFHSSPTFKSHPKSSCSAVESSIDHSVHSAQLGRFLRYRVVHGFSAADHREAEMQLHQLDAMKRRCETGAPRAPRAPNFEKFLVVTIATGIMWISIFCFLWTCLQCRWMGFKFGYCNNFGPFQWYKIRTYPVVFFFNWYQIRPFKNNSASPELGSQAKLK